MSCSTLCVLACLAMDRKRKLEVDALGPASSVPATNNPYNGRPYSRRYYDILATRQGAFAARLQRLL